MMASKNTSYTWEYRIAVPPYDRLIEVLEAFFSSYAGGDYTCELRERYRLEFRRGLWRRSLLGLGAQVPDRLIRGQFKRWPIMVRVLARPSPSAFMTTVRYEVHLPKAMPTLPADVQSSVDLHIRKELNDLTAYLAECIGLDEPPAFETL